MIKVMAKKRSVSNNPIFKNEEEYSCFVLNALQKNENNNLPIAFECSYPMNISMNDIKTFSNRFKKDTGLSIQFHQYTCDNCERLHFVIEIYNE